jgi:hypothetical protein
VPQAEGEQRLHGGRPKAQLRLHGRVGEPGPSVGPEEQHAVLHRGQDEVGRAPGVLGGRAFAPELVVTSGALASLRSSACPFPAQERQRGDADQDPAERDDDRDGVHREAV